MGGGSRFLMYKEEDKALEALNRAFDLGITYMDTAYGYGGGLSETRVGKVLKERRKKDGIFLATKIEARNGDEAARTVEGSLKRLQTDQIDLVHIHSLEDEEDLKQVDLVCLKPLQADQIDLVHIHSLEDEEDLKQIEAKGNILDRL